MRHGGADVLLHLRQGRQEPRTALGRLRGTNVAPVVVIVRPGPLLSGACLNQSQLQYSELGEAKKEPPEKGGVANRRS